MLITRTVESKLSSRVYFKSVWKLSQIKWSRWRVTSGRRCLYEVCTRWTIITIYADNGQSYNYLYVSSVSICNTSGGEYGSHSLCRRTTVFILLVSPKSHSLIREKSLLNTRMLSSLMSRCTSSRLWMWCTAAASCLATLFAWSSPKPVSVTLDVRSPEIRVQPYSTRCWIATAR